MIDGQGVGQKTAYIEEILPPPWDLLDSLIIESQLEGHQLLVRLKQEYESGKERFDRPGEVLLGIFEQGQLIAVCGLTRDPYSADPHIGRVRHLYVRSNRRRQGVGQALMREIQIRARTAFSSLNLRTHSAVAARFYEKLGFERLDNSASSTHQRLLR